MVPPSNWVYLYGYAIKKKVLCLTISVFRVKFDVEFTGPALNFSIVTWMERMKFIKRRPLASVFTYFYNKIFCPSSWPRHKLEVLETPNRFSYWSKQGRQLNTEKQTNREHVSKKHKNETVPLLCKPLSFFQPKFSRLWNMRGISQVKEYEAFLSV